jgi:RNA ligase (TIGR02306 family)
MSTEIKVKVVEIEEVKPHPNADRMELVRTGGWWCCTQIGTKKVGDKAIYLPPDSVVPIEWTDKWEITKYCSDLPMVNGERKDGKRIRAARLRGVPSFGVLLPLDNPNWPIGKDVTNYYNVTKYEPPVKTSGGRAILDLPNLNKYTNIDNISNVNDMFTEGEPVIITEKIHGSNSVVGYIKDTYGNMIYVASSHNMRRSIEDNFKVTLFKKWSKKFLLDYSEIGKTLRSKILVFLYENFKNSKFIKVEREMFGGLYSLPLKNDSVREALLKISDRYDDADILFYGEIYGPGIQDMTYGLNSPDYLLFDISVNGEYLSELDKQVQLNYYPDIIQVPILYRGPFSQEKIDELVSGPTTVCDPKIIKEKFKGREGIVIKPLEESKYKTCSRKIAKYISVDYHERKNENQTENH